MSVARLDQTNFDAFVSDHETVVIGFLENKDEATRFAALAQPGAVTAPGAAFGMVDSASRALFEMLGLNATATGIFRQRVILYLEAGLPDASRLSNLLDGVAALDMDRVRAEIDEERARAALATHMVCPTARRGKMS